MELGAAARMAGRSARATEAYAAARRRFAGSDSAATAAFHLGQLAFDGARAFAEAHGWFETYLAERPQGALAAEALGRAMEAELRMGDPSARATAEKYVARFPDGAHAALAKRILAR
jgi:TolA-binding protein